MADNHSKEARSMNMSHIRSTNSKPEEIVRKYLFAEGFRYRKNVKKLPGCPDIVLSKYKTVIFVNGCFWHKHDCPRFVWPSSNQDYWRPKILRNVERDNQNRKELEALGWKVITVWECEIMQRAYYSAKIKSFLDEQPEVLLGKLMISEEFSTTDLQKNAWRKEIQILQDQLRLVENGDIAFEYTIPRMGHRIDVVCIIRGLIFLLEFKVGDSEYRKSTADQVMDYALDLKYFHELSTDRYIIPISVPTEAPAISNKVEFMEDKISKVLKCTKSNIALTINSVLDSVWDKELSIEDWINSIYTPTPTIIEAAQAMYRNHSVKDISRNDAGAHNLTATTETINRIIDDCKRRKKKAICFVTGVPGAGKTLAGLNIANERHNFDADEHAVFLSGNGPLVDVLQAALAQDRSSRTGITIAAAKKRNESIYSDYSSL